MVQSITNEEAPVSAAYWSAISCYAHSKSSDAERSMLMASQESLTVARVAIST